MNTPLQKAAQAVITRWDSPAWKDQPHTAEFIAELRKALDAEIAQSVEPSWYEHIEQGFVVSAREWAGYIVTQHEYAPLYRHPPQEQFPVAFRKANQDGFYRYYEADEIQPELCEPLYLHPPQQAKQVLMSADAIRSLK